MPELPDVEVFKRYLDATSLHKTISKTAVENGRVLEDISVQSLKRELEGRQFESSKRHGKYLLVHMDNGSWLTLHFGMTGRLKYFKGMDKFPDHTRLLIYFSNGFHLAYDCQRMLGNISLIDDADRFIEERGLGPDALDYDFDFSAFKNLLHGRKGSIKAALMDQELIAGIGNIYSDEILFQAEVHPKAPVNQLDEKTLRSIFNEMKSVLRTAVECKVDLNKMPDSFILRRRDTNGRCPRCNRELQRLKISSRSAYLCSHCQYKG